MPRKGSNNNIVTTILCFLVLPALLAACGSDSNDQGGINNRPIASLGGDLSVFVGDEVSLDASSSSDPDGDALTFEWSQLSGPEVTLALVNGGEMASFNAPAVEQQANLVFELVVSDGHLSSAPATVTVTVSPVPAANTAPVAVAGEDRLVVSNQIVYLDGTLSHDADGDPLSHAWLQTEGPEVELHEVAEGVVQFVAPEVETGHVLRFALVVNDGLQDSEPATVDISVSPLDHSVPISLQFELRKMNAAEGGDVDSFLDGVVKLETIGPLGEVLATQKVEIVPGEQSTVYTPTESDGLVFRIALEISDSYYFLPGSTDYVFGYDYSLEEIQDASVQVIPLDLFDNTATAYLRVVHIVENDDPEYPETEVGTVIVEAKALLLGLQDLLDKEECYYIWTDIVVFTASGRPLSTGGFSESYGCMDINANLFTLKFKPENWLDAQSPGAKWDSYTAINYPSGESDEFEDRYSVGERLFIDGDLVE